MICISIAQESRKLAMFDMLNAVALGADMMELRLDSFEKDPDFSELFEAKRRPIIMSARRKEDGGNWDGTEEERLMLLRQAIISKSDYVDIELDIADSIRPFPGSMRVISYTNLKETPSDIAEIYAEMQTKKPDVIKLTCKARTPEEAWPLVQILAKPPVPTVVVGLGRPGVMLAVLGRKIGAPYTFAALERGMEVYPGQPTIRDLEEIYHYRAIDRSTKFVGVTGLGEREFLTIGLLNTAFAAFKLNMRCLPMQVGNPKVFRKVIDAAKLQGVIIDDDNQETTYQIAAYDESAKAPVQAADMLVPSAEGWHGTNLFGSAVVEAVRATMSDHPESFKGRSFCIVGVGGTARMIAAGVKAAGGSLIFASKDRNASTRLATLFGGRHIAFEGLYTTSHDVLIVCPDALNHADDDEEISESGERQIVHPGYLRPGMVVMDLTSLPRRTRLLREAKLRGCHPVDPRLLMIEQVRTYAKRLTNQEISVEALQTALDNWAPDEDEG